MQEYGNHISIAIPAYEMRGKGVEYLNLGLDSILQQTFKDVEVVVSDHSITNDIQLLCESYGDKLNIKYLRYEENRGKSSANLNNAIKNCTGYLIKFLFQDEFFCDVDALQKIKFEFDSDTNLNWLVSGCNYGTVPFKILGSIIPSYSDSMIESKNTIGSPSVLTIRNQISKEYFNDELIWVMDCDYYIRLYNKYGYPKYITDSLVFILQHSEQLSNILQNQYKLQEQEFLLQTYKK